MDTTCEGRDLGNGAAMKSLPGLWLPTVWYLLVSTRSISRWLAPSDFDDSLDAVALEGSPVDRIVLTVMIGLGIAILAKRDIDWSEVLKRNKWLLGLFLYMALSVVWSEFPELTAKRWVRSFGALVMVMVALTPANPLEQACTLLRRCYYVHLPLSLLAIKYSRNIGVHYSRDGLTEMWRGLTTHKNNLGQVAMSSGVFFAWETMKKWGAARGWIALLFLSMCVWLLKGSSTSASSTAVIGCGIGVCALIGVKVVKNNPQHLRRYAAASVVLAAAFLAVADIGVEILTDESFMSFFTGLSGRDATLTGRIDLWNDILALAANRPVLGVGFGAFWIGDAGNEVYPLVTWSEKISWRPGQGHNGYLDVYVELGLIGMLFIIGIILEAWRNLSRLIEHDFEYARLRIAFLAIVLFNNVTESSLLKGTHNLWFLFLLVAVNIPTSPKSRRFVNMQPGALESGASRRK